MLRAGGGRYAPDFHRNASIGRACVNVRKGDAVDVDEAAGSAIELGGACSLPARHILGAQGNSHGGWELKMVEGTTECEVG